MHILPTTSAALDDLVEPVDLRHAPADVLVLSFSDSDLAGLAAAWTGDAEKTPSLRIAALKDLRHPMSVDLWTERTAANAKLILVRILGGYDWWRYGCDALAALARQKDIALALLPGECRERDERLIECSTLPPPILDRLLGYFREGGAANMRALSRDLAALAEGRELPTNAAIEVPKAGFYRPGLAAIEAIPADTRDGRPVVPILFYRSMLLAADTAPVDALAEALDRRGIAAVPIFVASLKDQTSLSFVETAFADFNPSVIVTTTAFSAGAEPGAETLFDRAGVPVFQVALATARREAWLANPRGLGPSDLAMHVVLPELDGRILAGAIAFKSAGTAPSTPGFTATISRPEPDRVEHAADRIAAMIRLQRKPPAERKLAILMPDYPSAPGRTGYAVGLDVPASVIAMLHDLKAAGYSVEGIPDCPRALLDQLKQCADGLSVEDYLRLSADLPGDVMDAVLAAWGAGALITSPISRSMPPPFVLPHISPSRGEISSFDAGDWPISLLEGEMSGRTEGGAQERRARQFPFRAIHFGNVTVALAPDRGDPKNRRADYHDAALPPRHELVAFGLWLRHTLGCHAIVHVGAHGTLEWLPGKTAALTRNCFPEIVAGALPVVYPFIVSNPGEAAQAKRRIAAVTIGHLPSPVRSALDEDQQTLERLVDEYAQADGLDRRRRDRLAKLIVETAAKTGLATRAGVASIDAPDEALHRIDAWLCDLKDFSLRDGLHVFGRASEGETDPLRLASSEAERIALLDALDGKHIRPGPSGAPARSRADVLPTGRNIYTADPRAMPTATAYDLGKLAADEVLRRYCQDHGDFPRALVIDLWGSASLRTGGEEIAQGLVMMGCRPVWDAATGRVTGVEVLPQATLGRPRVDVTWRISGLFRDMFAGQIALMDAAARAVAAMSEDDADNPLAAERRQGRAVPPRIFGSSPGTYGSGIEHLLADGGWQDRAELGRAYLDATSHVFEGAEGTAIAAPNGFAERVAAADLLIHTGDDPGRDILDGSADVAFAGGFSAALAALGSNADVIMLDTSDPARPRPRSVVEAVTRVVRARATNSLFIAGQMRHGPRGASEFAETVDRLVGFAETTEAIPGNLIGDVHDAYLGDATVLAFLLRENPEAASFIARRFADARRRGLWHPLRNSVDDDLAALIAEASAMDVGALPLTAIDPHRQHETALPKTLSVDKAA